MSRIAVVLFNLGGPDRPQSVRPFLFNLFNDRAIIALPQPFRWLLARLISGRRAATARAIYDQMGGGSPLLANTEAQARALEAALGPGHRCFVAMRYWHPLSEAASRDVAAWNPDRVVLLPLYPQYSTTTTASSLTAWHAAARRTGLRAPAAAICCYPRAPGLIAAMEALIRETLAQLPAGTPYRMLFSAHGLPKKIVRSGDPYQCQIEATVGALRAALDLPELDSVICYQSRVGPLEWIGPATDAEIARAGTAGLAVIVVPIAFVSEHSETLVELGIEYRHLAERSGAPAYHVVPTAGVHAAFIAGLADLVRNASGSGLRCGEGTRFCPDGLLRCPLATATQAA
ncbi:MAG TPA: ferrochelatase [Stellaceae bacterium]|nr:ferrochelatase [Stellaceae bacterium]